MRYCAINTKTDMPVQMSQGSAKEAAAAAAADVEYFYLARIRCLDCTGKLYTPGPDTTVGNFEVHIKNRQHREKVAARVAREQQQQQGMNRSGNTSNGGQAVAGAIATAPTASSS